jgi:mono/diheme cytochrome c family protein
MRKQLVFAGSMVLTLFWLAALVGSSTWPAAAHAAAPLDGKQVFLAQKCNLCHMVSSAGIEATTKSEKMKGPDLTGVGSRRDAKLMHDFLRKTAEIDGKKHGKEFTGSDEDLAGLIAWLQKQEKK